MSVSKPGRLEFMVLMAAMTAVEAFSIDAVAPALGEMSGALALKVDNYRQFVITVFTLGFAIGLLVYGFVADHFGRRKPVLCGFVIYLAGSSTCTFADSFAVLVFGRIIQGIGAAGPYVISIAIVRDKYVGKEMASVMSLIMMVFIGVPIIAPFIGQGFLLWLGWRSIFMAMVVFGVLTLLWFFLRQTETLKQENRVALSLATIKESVFQIMSCGQAVRYLLAMGMILGSFYAFLSTGQQIFQEIYDLGDWFPAVYAGLSSVIGVSSYLNSRWVEALGGIRLVHRALATMVIISAIFLLASLLWTGSPPLPIYMIYLLVMMFNFGLLFGNIIALAMEPLGEIAGAASSVIGAISTFIAFVVAIVIGGQLDANATTLVAGFFVSSCIAWVLNYQGLRVSTTPPSHSL